jgi:3-oxoacyl-[acyl-carrier protein] reductase
MTPRTAVVTGASRGIGKQIAIELGRLGWNVVVAARTVEPHRRLAGTMADTVAAVEEAGGRALAVRTDMTVPEDIRHLVETTVDTFGAIDALINNAAQTAGGSPPLVELAVEDWRQQFETNVHGPLQLMQAVVPTMQRAGGGVIVNMTSGAGDLSSQSVSSSIVGDAVRIGERIAYAASKAALNRLANVVAPELAASGIAIVNVDPGFTRTELVDLMDERGVVDAEAAVPMEVPMRAVVDLVTTEGAAMRHTGDIVRAAAYVAALAG